MVTHGMETDLKDIFSPLYNQCKVCSLHCKEKSAKQESLNEGGKVEVGAAYMLTCLSSSSKHIYN